jgi:phosphocarrier protein
MLKKSFVVKDKDGLHARPASLLAGLASKYLSKTDIIYNEQRYTLKSIMVIMSLGVAHNEEFSILTEGEDESAALGAIEDLLIEHGII